MNNSYMMPVRRMGPHGPRIIRVCMPPSHPRFHASLHHRVKEALVEEDRFKLCSVLFPHFKDAMERSALNPILVEVGEDTYALHRGARGKVYIKFHE